MSSEFPAFTNLYQFFHPNCKSTVVWSFGLSDGDFETCMHEVLGCKVNIFDSKEESQKNFDIIQRIITDHEKQDSDPEWAELIETRWVKEDSLHFSKELPFTFSGQLDISGSPTSLKEISVKENPRVDICKIDYDSFTPNLIYSILNAGYRPGLLYVHWPVHPDSSTQTMICAGHLQTCGYTLYKSNGNYFVYRFIDDVMYEVCSWARTDTSNPMFEEFKNHILQSYYFQTPKQSEKDTSHEGSDSKSPAPSKEED
jgi:hypothetical protein